jgi:hypothetical protein
VVKGFTAKRIHSILNTYNIQFLEILSRFFCKSLFLSALSALCGECFVAALVALWTYRPTTPIRKEKMDFLVVLGALGVLVVKSKMDSPASTRSTKHQARRTTHQARRTKHDAPSTTHQARRTKHDAPSTTHQARSTKHEARSTKHEARSTKHEARSTKHEMKYDISSKILIEKCRGEILRRLVGLSVAESTVLEQLPQETVSLKRSDFPVLVTDEEGERLLVLLEVQSRWESDVPLRLLDYRCRYLLKERVKAISCVMLLRPSGEAGEFYEDNEVSFRFRLVRVYELDARDIIREGGPCLMPFVPLMRHGEEFMAEAERLLYESSLPREDKADMLTAMAILSGLVSSRLPEKLLARGRDIMIESAAYDLIKQEGLQEGLQKGLQEGLEVGMLRKSKEAVIEILEARFDLVPRSISTAINAIEDLVSLKALLRKAATVESLDRFNQLMHEILNG